MPPHWLVLLGPSKGSTWRGRWVPRPEETNFKPCLSSTRTTNPRRTTPRPRRGRTSGGGVATDSQTLMIRRAVAAGLGLLILVLLVIAVKSCRDSAHENALRDYNRQISSIGDDSARQVGAPFFQLLTEGGAAAGSADEHLQLPRAGRAAVRPGGEARRPRRHEGRPAVGADRAGVAARRAREDRQPDHQRARRPGRDDRRRDQEHRRADAGVPRFRRGLADARRPVHQERARQGRRRPASGSAARSSCPTSTGCSRRRSPACSTRQLTSRRQQRQRAADRPRPARHRHGLDDLRRHDAPARDDEPAHLPAEPAVRRQVHQPGRERRVRHQGHAADLGRERQRRSRSPRRSRSSRRRSRRRWSCRSTASRRSAPRRRSGRRSRRFRASRRPTTTGPSTRRCSSGAEPPLRRLSAS